MKITLQLLLCALLLVTSTKTNAQANTQDSLVLVDFYNNTDGSNWLWNTNWLTLSPVKTWKGITLDDNGRVTEIDLAGNELKGTIPSSIGNLVSLQNIYLSNNQLTGSLPGTFANIIYLGDIDVSNNKLSGNIPAELGSLKYLGALKLSNNNFSGNIPADLGNMTGLYQLKIDGNKLSGPIPQSLLNLQNLEGLMLNNNNLTYDGLEPLIQKFPFTVYSPQRAIALNYNNGKLSVSPGGTLNNNTYKWYHGATLVHTVTGDSTYLPAATGKYTVQVNNTIATALTLYSDSFTVEALTDSLVLVALYNNTNGPNWINHTGWLTSPLKNWYGIMLDINGRVTGINLAANGLSGSISSPLLAYLDKLQNLNISNNYFNFDNVEPLAQQFGFVIYAPQKTTLSLHLNNNKLSVSAGGSLGNNTYHWYYGATLVKTVTGDSTYTPAATGNYSVSVTNTVASLLTLYSDTLSAEPGETTLDSLALVALYHSTGGANWINHNNWLTMAPAASWFGVTVNENGRVTALNLPNNNLQYVVTDSLNLLTQAMHIDFSNNNLTGFQTSLPSLPALLQVNLSHNRLNLRALDPVALTHNLLYEPQEKLPLYYYLNTAKDSITFYSLEYLPYPRTISYEIYKLENGQPVAGPGEGWIAFGNDGGKITMPNVPGDYFMDIIDFIPFHVPQNKLALTTQVIHIGGTLPVKLINFKCNAAKGTVQLSWQTTTEKNAKNFVVQRSTNGHTFANIAYLPAIGNSTILRNYYFTDMKPSSGNNFYRLLIQDADGKFDYSNIIPVNISATEETISLYPNPADSRTTLQFNCTSAEKYSILITDRAGKILQQQNGMSVAGNNSVTINLYGLAPGTYFVTLSAALYGKKTLQLNRL